MERFFSQHKETFERYFPLETRTDPDRIAKIKNKVEGRVRTIADYVHGQGLKVSIYTQNPPSDEYLNNVMER